VYKTTILDGYIDEPTCLGVPPYISTYPRYIAGAIWDADSKNQIFYLTIDQLRQQTDLKKTIEKSDALIIIAGMSVPGRYQSGYPLGPRETQKLTQEIKKPIKILAGPAATHGFGTGGGQQTRNLKRYFDINITGDSEIVIKNLYEKQLKTKNVEFDKKRKKPEDIQNFAEKGSKIVTMHPFFPDYLIAEIETYRGCPRSIHGGCSFCSEPLKGLPQFRPINHIVQEIKKLYNHGIRHIRIGNQPCIFSYQSKKIGIEEFPEPNPEAIKELFGKIRKNAPNLKTLHIDNANPGVIAKHPEKSKKITKTIIKHHTPGDTAAFGVESIDPEVVKQNNLKADEEEIIKAIKILNQIGRKTGYNGMPELLPGLNFVFGLKGETKKTFELDYNFLERILDENLLLRRINLRQITPIPGTKMYEIGNKIAVKNKKYFKKFKNKVKENIERPLLEKMLPAGSILKDIYTEKHDGKLTFGRQIGSYPLLVGIVDKQKIGEFIDVKIIDHGYRSITGIKYPLNINYASLNTLENLPGVGKKRANKIILNRPYNNSEELKKVFDDPEIIKKFIDYISFLKKRKNIG
jgi:radical SAM superfamily enzyme with C-terminal helix-hairpin-helix motif